MEDPTTTVGDAAKVAQVRAELPVTARATYMNTGTNGPLPVRSHSAMLAWAERDLTEGRIRPSALPDLLAAWSDARAEVADLLGCDSEEIALTHSTTEGINIALSGMTWRPGDEIVTASTEHSGVLYPVYQTRQRYGARIRMTDIGRPDVDAVSALKAALSPRTRAVVLSHVSWSTGARLPLRALVDATHRAGALFICDAAQSCGMIPSNVRDLDVDVYALSGQKWLCGPDGTGAVYVRRDRFSEIEQTYMGYFGVRPGMSDLDGHFVPSASAVRYEGVTVNPATVVALTESLRWIQNDVGWPWAYERIARLARVCHQRLSRLSATAGVTVSTPLNDMAGLVHFTVGDVKPSEVVQRLADDHVYVRALADPVVVRASIGFYNTAEEIERLAERLAAIGAGS